MNSRTSRPRSLTRQITFTSADVERAIIPINEDLPTPEPAKMPSRCPRPHGTKASSARTPSDTRSEIGGRDSAAGGAPPGGGAPNGGGGPPPPRPPPPRPRGTTPPPPPAPPPP